MTNIVNSFLRQHEGVKFDNEKPNMSLLESEFLEGTADVLTFGARKYAAHNWAGGIHYSRLISASMRHLAAINRGENLDPETGLQHAYHVACNMQFLSWMINHRKDLDDRFVVKPLEIDKLSSKGYNED